MYCVHSRVVLLHRFFTWINECGYIKISIYIKKTKKDIIKNTNEKPYEYLIEAPIRLPSPANTGVSLQCSLYHFHDQYLSKTITIYSSM